MKFWTSDDELDDVRSLVETLRSGATVEARKVYLAGPLEVLLAVSAVVGGLGGGAGGVAALLTLWAQRHPERPIHIVLEDRRTLIVDGRDLDPGDAQAIDDFFDQELEPGVLDGPLVQDL